MAITLTAPQLQLLDRIRATGAAGLVQNGRARRTVEALEAAGLITYEYDLIPRADSKWVERFHCRAVTQEA